MAAFGTVRPTAIKRNNRPHWIAAALVLATSPALADGPALAHLTLDGRTITLTADPAVTAPRMIRQTGNTLHLRFAQLHLGFPTPPMLNITLTHGESGWSVQAMHLDRTSDRPAVVFAPAALDITQTGDADQIFRIEGEALSPDRPPLPVSLLITMHSP